jgi:hypothetical protein
VFIGYTEKATCFTKMAKATLLDLILTCQECDFKKVCNFGTGISDVHNFIVYQLSGQNQCKSVHWTYRRAIKLYQ